MDSRRWILPFSDEESDIKIVCFEYDSIVRVMIWTILVTKRKKTAFSKKKYAFLFWIVQITLSLINNGRENIFQYLKEIYCVFRRKTRPDFHHKFTMAESQELPNCGLKCRKCRSGFLAEIEHDGIKSTSDLYVFSEENMPQWVSQKVEEV